MINIQTSSKNLTGNKNVGYGDRIFIDVKELSVYTSYKSVEYVRIRLGSHISNLVLNSVIT